MTDALRDQLQTALGANYTLDRELGGGGMSRVFVARDETLARDVVVKVLAPMLAQELSTERFTREIKLAAALQEPHIVPVINAGATIDGTPFYVMPFVRGASLRDRLEHGLVPRDEAMRILRDVAQALAYAHERGIAHRDIKPENILLSSGTAVVTDFGIAKALQLSRTTSTDDRSRSGLTQTGTSLGTPAYMAPEQAAGDPNTDQRVDIYAWRVVAYELLAGKHPFAGRTTPQQIMAAHFSQKPASLAVTASAISPGVARLVMQCLEKDAADRPVSAEVLVAALDSVKTRAVGYPINRLRSVIAAVVLLASAIGGWWWNQQRNTNAEPVMIAVLPFEHSGPPEEQSFTDGLTDAVTSKLAGLSSLAVIDRQSASAYRASAKSAKQIGAELRVAYLLEGVVRWTKDNAGVWKARVTPTLVDAVTGTTTWTGKPVDVNHDDPFTAQGAIATDVAKEMEVVLLPSERAALTRHYTSDPQALAAFRRGRAIIDGAIKTGSGFEVATRERSAAEFEIAVKLDSNFGEAWANVAGERLYIASLAPRDTVARRRAEDAVAQALKHAPNDPQLMLWVARKRMQFDNDSSEVIPTVRRAVRAAPNDAFLLMTASQLLDSRPGQTDSAYALAQRAARLDPRSPNALERAAFVATKLDLWSEALAYADALIALDSTHNRGWLHRVRVGEKRKDTANVRREISRAVAALPRPELLQQAVDVSARFGLLDDASRYASLWVQTDSTNESLWVRLAVYDLMRGDTLNLQNHIQQALRTLKRSPPAAKQLMTLDGGEWSRRFLRFTPKELEVFSFRDSVSDYYDSKSDAATRVDNPTLSRIYSDSVRMLLQGPKIGGADSIDLLHFLAFAQANSGQVAAARQTIARLLAAVPPLTRRPFPSDSVDVIFIAGTFVTLGDFPSASRWLEADLSNPGSILGARWYLNAPSLLPKLKAFSRSPEFDRLRRAYPE